MQMVRRLMVDEYWLTWRGDELSRVGSLEGLVSSLLVLVIFCETDDIKTDRYSH